MPTLKAVITVGFPMHTLSENIPLCFKVSDFLRSNVRGVEFLGQALSKHHVDLNNINVYVKYVEFLSLTFQVTGELRYLEFQGNGENTSSFPKFEIANYDVTRIHVHEQKCVHFRLKLS